MKPGRSVALATWVLEHFTSNESLSGDLLEEFAAGRSATWYWRQVSTAIGAVLLCKLQDYTLAIVFSAGWSTLYTLWRFLSRDRLTRVIPGQWATLSWPYSSVTQISSGVLPAITFVWLGLLVYLVSRTERVRGLSPFRIILSLSTSLSVLLIATMGLLRSLADSRMDLRNVMREDFYTILHIFAISIPIALSLFAAIVSVQPRIPRLARRKQSSRRWLDTVADRFRNALSKRREDPFCKAA